jgi:hypothetical protein
LQHGLVDPEEGDQADVDVVARVALPPPPFVCNALSEADLPM